jgi:threonine dehydratase
LHFNSSSDPDLLLAGAVGKWTFPIIRDLVQPDDVMTITDDEMVEGIKLIAERLKVIVELPAGAGIIAAIKAKKRFPELKRIGVVLCGGNLDLEAACSYFGHRNE